MASPLDTWVSRLLKLLAPLGLFMHRLLRTSQFSLRSAIIALSTCDFGTFRCLGDDGLIALKWSYARTIFAECLTDLRLYTLTEPPSLTQEELRHIGAAFVRQFQRREPNMAVGGSTSPAALGSNCTPI